MNIKYYFLVISLSCSFLSYGQLTYKLSLKKAETNLKEEIIQLIKLEVSEEDFDNNVSTKILLKFKNPYNDWLSLKDYDKPKMGYYLYNLEKTLYHPDNYMIANIKLESKRIIDKIKSKGYVYIPLGLYTTVSDQEIKYKITLKLSFKK